MTNEKWEKEKLKSPHRNLCTCYDVEKIYIMKVIESGATTIASVSAKTYCCQGSRCCERQIQFLIDTYNKSSNTNI
jgi:NAD(P)H-nitrite reductase large subunit